MNARISVPVVRTLGETLAGLWDRELERNALGAAMLAETVPAWLEPRHFFPTQHQRIYEAVQSVGGNPARVNAWLRESSPKFGPPIAEPTDLAEMCLEAEFAWKMGWVIEWEQLRELWRQRCLVEAMRRVEIELHAGTIDHRDARRRLSDHFAGCK